MILNPPVPIAGREPHPHNGAGLSDSPSVTLAILSKGTELLRVPCGATFTVGTACCATVMVKVALEVNPPLSFTSYLKESAPVNSAFGE